MHLQKSYCQVEKPCGYSIETLLREKLAAMNDLSSKHSIRCAVLPLMFFKVDL